MELEAKMHTKREGKKLGKLPREGKVRNFARNRGNITSQVEAHHNILDS